MGGSGAKDKRDIYYRAGKEFGFRARSAFKLLQIDEAFHIFSRQPQQRTDNADGTHNTDEQQHRQHDDKPLRIVDLCAAPGAWTEVCQLRTTVDNASSSSASIVAVDLQSMNPIDGVQFIKGDITRQSTVTEIIAAMDNQLADIVLFDGAPDVTGLHSVDESIQHRLLLSAFNIARCLLLHDADSVFIGKVFRGRRCSQIYAYLTTQFHSVTLCKPRCSRNASIEAFVVCRGYTPTNSSSSPLSLDVNQPVVIPLDVIANADEIAREKMKFVSCGGGFQHVKCADQQQCRNLDSDKTYPLSYRLQSTEHRDAAASDNVSSTKKVIANQPIDAPYRVALAMKRSNQLSNT